MLESVDLSLVLPKSAAKGVLRAQQERLLALCELTFERKIPVIIAFEGWDASGKGTTIRKLTQRLDPRGFKVLPTRAAMPHERNKPWLWRFWMNIPRHGQIAIFDRSWYGRVMVERVEGLTAIPDWIRAYEEINAFERTLAADGTVFVKLFLHISKAEQLRRFVKLTQQPETAWQVTADDWEQHRRYDDYVRAVEDMLANTNIPEVAPWEIVPATNKEYCQFAVFRTVIRRLEDSLGLEPSPDVALELIHAEEERRKAEREARKAEKDARKVDKEARKVDKEARKAEKEAGKAEKEAGKAGKEAGKAGISAGKPEPTVAGGKKKRKRKEAEPAEPAVLGEAAAVELEYGSLNGDSDGADVPDEEDDDA